MSGLSVLVAAALCFLRVDVTQGQYTACFRGDNPLCVCTLTPESQFEVDCSFKNIMAAIDGIPNTTVSLDLSGNMLQDIPLGFLRNLSVLKLLNIENNALVVLRNDTFAGLRNLTSLFLGGNDLIDIEKDAFKSVSHLQQLRLNNNKLTIITNGTFDENPLGTLFSTVKFINVTSEDCDKNCLRTKYVGLVVLVGVGCSVVTLISTCIFFFLCIRNKSKKKQRRRSKLNSDSNETSGNRISEMIPMISVAEAPSGDHDRDYNQEQETFLGTFQKKNSKPQKDQPSAAVQEKNSSEGYAHPQPAVVQSDQGQATRAMTPDNHYMRVTIDFDSNDAINL
ncbi:hypothetical protein Bbelb_151400 [Branchiostoma belcheri]|nr:hypothetical protein Bbelb_151400 [Branchiostoma belcheri]